MQTSAPPPEIKLGDHVGLVGTTEKGTVTGRATYPDSATQYLVRYVNTAGCLSSEYFPAEALTADPETPAVVPHPSPQPAQFPHGHRVRLIESGEAGTVVGLIEFLHDNPLYKVRYVNGQGSLTTKWWVPNALTDDTPCTPAA